MRTIGVAFGGGGARGLAHIGVLRALRRHDLEPDMVAGTSVGSITAAMCAGDMEQQLVEEVSREFDWLKHVINIGDTAKGAFQGKRGGLVSNATLGTKINEFLEGRTFRDLSVDLAVVATDIERARRVIFTSPEVAERLDRTPLERYLPPPTDDKPGCDTLVVGDFDDVGMAVRASCAVPGVFRPVEIRDMRLLDGGVVDQVPVDVITAMGAHVKVGISLGMAYMPDKVTSFTAAIAAMVGIMGIRQIRGGLDMADVAVRIQGIEKRSPVNPRQFDLVDLGEQAIEDRLEDLLRAAGRRPSRTTTRVRRC